MDVTSRFCFNVFFLVFLLCHFEGPTVNATFSVIRNSTFICENGNQQFRKIDLTDNDKLELLELKGGHFLSAYMSFDHRSAEENFVNLLEVPGDQYRKKQTRKSAVRNQLIEDVKKGQPNKEGKKSFEENSKDMQKEDSHSSTRGTKSTRGSHQNNLKSSNSEYHPYILPREIGLKDKYIITGKETDIEFCSERGSLTSDREHLHLCTICAATTNLEGDMFPGIFNEAICSPDENGCFYADGHAHGRCQQSTMVIDVLKRTPNVCSLALKDNEVVVVEEWELSNYQLFIGCECALHSGSIFAPYV